MELWAPMIIILNGKEHFVNGQNTIAGLLEDLGQDAGRVVVEHNGRIVTGEGLKTARLQEGDVLEMVRLVGGG